MSAKLDLGSSPADRPTILVVEDDAHIRDVLSGLLGTLGYRMLMAASAEQALDALNVVSPDLVLTDVHLGAMSGIELCVRLKADPRYELMPVVILTAVGDLEARVAGLAAGADDFFTKPVAFVELRTRLGALLRVRLLLSQLERAEAVITTLALTIEARDPYTLGHCDRLSRYAVAVGEGLGLDPEMVRSLRLGGYLHDLGKIAVPDGILLKPGPLDPIEYERIRAHPGAGSDLVLGLRSMELVRPIMRHHHEKWDGSGYPDGLKGEAIPLGARIISVVDVFDALHTERPYKAALSRSEAVSTLIRETDLGYWDPRVVETFLEILRHFKHDA
ncbi:MAG TPA: HD domain-containing phosphohydrolase [Candidatus Acidoferrum sp.]|jgi:putative two-component system response regulator|nr:HD domain-containing phosphohydrolase [Candidatus Acidoferrum sp.]